ncbi:MAG: archease [Gammaproteobacteria bacterium]|nr:archease [Gammaproteobacteria bacterium]
MGEETANLERDSSGRRAGAYYEHYAHDADIGVRGIGDSLESAFAQAAVALTAVVCAPEKVTPAQSVQVVCDAPNRELLLVDWLNTVVFEMATRCMLFSRFDIAIRRNALSAVLWGESTDRSKHQPVVEVKGATYTDLRVQRDDQGRWVAQCIVDV